MNQNLHISPKPIYRFTIKRSSLQVVPFVALFILPLLLYPIIDTSGWISSSDVHALLEFAASLLAITAGIMILLHFLTTGRWFFLIISLGFVLIGSEEFVHAIFSFNRIWPEILPTFKLAISSTWLTGRFILVILFFIALVLGEREVVPAKRGLTAVSCIIIGLTCASSITLLIFNLPSLPSFVQLGSITKKLIELSLAFLFLVAFLFYYKIYIKTQPHSPLLWSIAACIIFQVLAHIFVFDAQSFYDSHWDTTHLIVVLGYFFPIFGVWGETIQVHKFNQTKVIELDKEMIEHKQAEKKLEEERALLRTLIDNLPDRIYIMDAQGHKILSNMADWQASGGKTMEDVIGKTDFDTYPLELAEDYWALDKAVIDSGISIINREEPGLDSQGNPVWVLSSKVALCDGQGKVVGLVGIGRDITERKRAEQQLAQYSGHLEEMVKERTRDLRETQEQLVRQERLATLGQMAGSIGHELRNPLGVIANAIYYLKLIQPDADQKVKEYLHIVEKETFTADKIVTDLLDFTRIKSVEREPAAVAELVRQTLQRFPALPLVEAALEIPPDLPPVYADPRQMVQVLGNLTINACQAMPTGGKLTITGYQQEQMVAIAVEDNGVGISPENMHHLFEPLFTTKLQGIGLGLAVSQKLAEANGGRIEVESEPGKGSTFTVYLPVYREEK